MSRHLDLDSLLFDPNALGWHRLNLQACDRAINTGTGKPVFRSRFRVLYKGEWREIPKFLTDDEASDISKTHQIEAVPNSQEIFYE